MSILIDTPVWSLALRRAAADLHARERRIVEAWAEAVRSGDAVLIGPVRQELLSGIRSRKTFRLLADRLADFPDLAIDRVDYIQAATFFNHCRASGVTGSTIDLLICAVAHRHEARIFTADSDFTRYAKHLPISLIGPEDFSA